MPVFCFDDRLLRGRHASGPRTQFMLESLRRPGRAARRHARVPARAARARAAGSRDATRGPASCTSARIGARSPAGGSSASRRPRARRTSTRSGTRACTRSTTSTGFAPSRAGRTRSSRPSTAAGCASRAGSRSVRPSSFGSLPSAVRKGRLPSLSELGLEQEVEDPLRAARRPGPRAAVALPALGRARLRGQPRRARRPTGRHGCRPTSTSAASRRARSRRGCRRGAGADAFRRQLCWRDFYHHVLLHHPAQRALRVPGPLPRLDLVEPREAQLRGLVRGPHRLSRSWTPGCASCGARAGCTTAPGWSSARS